VLPSSRPPQGA